jgi:hypothetical protein
VDVFAFLVRFCSGGFNTFPLNFPTATQLLSTSSSEVSSSSLSPSSSKGEVSSLLGRFVIRGVVLVLAMTFFFMMMLEIFCEGGIFTNYLLTLKNYVHKVLVQKKRTRKINVEWKCLRTKMYWSRLAKNYYDLEKINVEWSGPLISDSPKIL